MEASPEAELVPQAARETCGVERTVEDLRKLAEDLQRE